MCGDVFNRQFAQLNEKYGPGSLNPETGVFTPSGEASTN